VERREEEKRKPMPLFATGEIVGDYEPLYRYWREAGDKAEEAVLSNRDFEELQRLVVREGVERLDELLRRLTEWFKERVDIDAAQRAVSDYYGSRVDGEIARETIARILAGWLVEAGTEWNILRLRRAWREERDEK
jgi:hypothetical protein